jgi:SAM-dependent methyltransferase
MLLVSDLKSSRIVEYPWVYANTIAQGRGKRVLDVGSVGSQLPIALAQLGYSVWCIDVRPYEYGHLLPGVKSVEGDIRSTGFDNCSFDIITAISTIEHIGLGRYADDEDIIGDKKAVVEIHRLLVPGGSFLLTVPFGKRETFPSHRVYDTFGLSKLLDEFNIEFIEHFARQPSGFWSCSDAKYLEGIRSPRVENGLACVVARKPSVPSRRDNSPY